MQQYQLTSEGRGVNDNHQIHRQATQDIITDVRKMTQQPALTATHAPTGHASTVEANSTLRVNLRDQNPLETPQQNLTPIQAPTTLVAAVNTVGTKAVGVDNKFHWTCNKCTCENLATEEKCKICDAPWEWM